MIKRAEYLEEACALTFRMYYEQYVTVDMVQAVGRHFGGAVGGVDGFEYTYSRLLSGFPYKYTDNGTWDAIALSTDWTDTEERADLLGDLSYKSAGFKTSVLKCAARMGMEKLTPKPLALPIYREQLELAEEPVDEPALSQGVRLTLAVEGLPSAPDAACSLADFSERRVAQPVRVPDLNPAVQVFPLYGEVTAQVQTLSSEYLQSEDMAQAAFLQTISARGERLLRLLEQAGAIETAPR